ncbi:hypothetical protein ACLQ24_23700 [Micromonospora sp. DT4]|uniref:hypothetical protein n=1 Tax=Micromonospora sp. DT4 TaxID=3393438 RepID=UPI003CE6841F
MLRAVQTLTTWGFSRTLLWVLDRNENAQRFYRQRGWRHVAGSFREHIIEGATVAEV